MTKEKITEIVLALKANGLSVFAIEKELGWANGTLGKAAKGERSLTHERVEELDKYFSEKCNIPPSIKKTQMVVTEKGELKTIPSKKATVIIRDKMKEINKKFGEGTLMMFGDKPDANYEVVSTGSFGLDNALGIGGLPLGRIIEIFGWESTGKTTIALNVIANAQKKGLECLYIDAENAFDKTYAESLGVDISKIQYCQPSCGEEALEIANDLIESGQSHIIVFDSVAALVPKAELDGAMGESKMGLHARLMSQACRKMSSNISKSNAMVIFINQLRHKIGVMFGNPEVTTGGNALQFYASIRIEIKRSLSEKNSIMNGDVREGNLTTVKVVKNKCATPFQVAQFNIIYGKGIDKTSEIWDAAIEAKIFQKNAGGYIYDDGTVIIPVSKEILNDNEGFRDEIEAKLNQAN